MNKSSEQAFPGHYFQRVDEGPDPWFYVQPRLLVHIDDKAIAAIGCYFGKHLPKHGVILDVMSSWRSHLPDGFPKAKLVGLGLNDVEMAENPQLDEHVVQDVNASPTLPFADASFDAAIIIVSVQYLTKPLEVFREVCRVLKLGGTFHVVFSNRMFPTKAVAVWQMRDDHGHGELVREYFGMAGGWEGVEHVDISPNRDFSSDPVYIVRATRVE